MSEPFVNVIETVISTGNFNLRVNNERSDEIGRSARALDALLETTEIAIAKVLNLANSVVKAINEIAQG